MRLIANKPCSFGGEKFYIGDEIPAGMVADPAVQEKRGILTILKENEVVVDLGDVSGQEGLFTREAVDALIAEAIAAVEREKEAQLAELQQYTAELQETAPGAYEGTVQISVKSVSDGDHEQATMIPAYPEEIQLVFSILQMTAEEGIREIAAVTSENVLILLHASDSRKAIKNAAKKQADKLYSKGESNAPVNGNACTGTYTEGS